MLRARPALVAASLLGNSRHSPGARAETDGSKDAITMLATCMTTGAGSK